MAKKSWIWRYAVAAVSAVRMLLQLAEHIFNFSKNISGYYSMCTKLKRYSNERRELIWGAARGVLLGERHFGVWCSTKNIRTYCRTLALHSAQHLHISTWTKYGNNDDILRSVLVAVIALTQYRSHFNLRQSARATTSFADACNLRKCKNFSCVLVLFEAHSAIYLIAWWLFFPFESLPHRLRLLLADATLLILFRFNSVAWC